MLRRWLPRAIGPILLIALWWFSDLGRAGELLSRTRPWPLVVAALINLVLIVVKSWRWREIMRAQAIDYGYPAAIRAYTIAAGLAAWSPGRLGDFSKAISLSRERGISFGRAASSVIADRLLDVLVLTVTAAAGGASLLGPVGSTVTWCLVALALVIAYILTRWAGTSTAKRTREALDTLGMGGAGMQVEDSLEGLGRFARPSGRRALAIALPATLLSTLLTFCQGYLVALSLGVPVGFLRLSAGLGAASIASLLPLSVAGIGLREAALAVFLGPANIRLAEVLTFSATFLIVVNGSAALWGALTHALWPAPPEAPLRAGQADSGRGGAS